MKINGKKLRHIRENKNLTGHDVAVQMYLNGYKTYAASKISKIERGEVVKVTDQEIEALAEILEVTTSELCSNSHQTEQKEDWEHVRVSARRYPDGTIGIVLTP